MKDKFALVCSARLLSISSRLYGMGWNLPLEKWETLMDVILAICSWEILKKNGKENDFAAGA